MKLSYQGYQFELEPVEEDDSVCFRVLAVTGLDCSLEELSDFLKKEAFAFEQAAYRQFMDNAQRDAA